MRKHIIVIVLIVLAGALVVTAAPPASAAPPSSVQTAWETPPPDRGPRPLPGYVYGTPLEQLGQCPDTAIGHLPLSPVTGWTQRQFLAEGRLTPGTDPSVPSSVVLGEPCARGALAGFVTYSQKSAWGSSNTAAADIVMGWSGALQDDPASAFYERSSAEYYVVCQSSMWAAPGTQTTVTKPAFQAYLTASVREFPQWRRTSNSIYSFTGGCAYMVEMGFTVCHWKAGVGMAPRVCIQTRWSAERWYVGTPPDIGEQAALCAITFYEAAGCEDYREANPLSWQVCKDPPLPEWGYFDWLEDWVRHYSQCLFVPAGGWDWEERIPAAWEAGGIGQALNPLVNVVDSIRVSESCGDLINSEVEYLGHIQLNTCSWSSWGNLLKSALGVFIVVFFGLWAIQFVIGTVTSVMGRKTTPMAEGDPE